MAKTVQDSKARSDESRQGVNDITRRDTEKTGGSDAGVTNAELAPNDAAPLGGTPLDQPVQAEPTPVPASPATIEDPSRTLHSAFAVDTTAAPSFPGFPKTKYHPVEGARTVNDPNEEAALPGPARNWFDTAGEADMHRTEAEAQQVLHNNARVKADARLSAFANGGAHDLADEVVRGEAGVVRNSVAATESLKSGFAEPL